MNTEAVAILLAIERLHCSTQYTLPNVEEQNCVHCDGIPQGFQEDSPSEQYYPCSTLLVARSVASPETLKYVENQLRLENRK